MPFRLTLMGIKVECDTVQELMSVATQAQSFPLGKRRIVDAETDRDQTNRRSELQQSGLRSTEERPNGLIDVLKLLKDNPEGVHVSRVTETLGLDYPQGIGGKIAAGKKALEVNGFEWKEYVIRRKRRSGIHWQAGPRINKAITALESREGRSAQEVVPSTAGVS